jgi:two-component system LytT family response regulator
MPEGSRRIRAALVDDEELARRVLRELLAAHPDVEIVAECANGFEAVKAVAELKPDLLLLDVQMPKLDGFDVLDLLGGEIAVIFVTAYDSFALRAFEVHAVDYLLKPFGAERLNEALDRARQRIRGRVSMPVAEIVSTGRPQRVPLERLLIRDRGDVHVVPSARIDYIEAQDDYVSVKAQGQSYLKEQTLTELETLLDPGRFVRIHRRFILNVSRLAKIEGGTDSRTAVLQDGTELPISKTGYARLRELL